MHLHRDSTDLFLQCSEIICKGKIILCITFSHLNGCTYDLGLFPLGFFVLFFFVFLFFFFGKKHPDRSGVYRQYSFIVAAVHTESRLQIHCQQVAAYFQPTLQLLHCICSVYTVYAQPILQVHCRYRGVVAVYTAWYCRYTPLRSG